MRFGDLVNPERGPRTLLKLVLFPLILLIVFQFVLCSLTRLPLEAGFVLLCIMLLLSPLAYLIRQSRQGRPRGQRPRGGAERTPLLPQDQEDQ